MTPDVIHPAAVSVNDPSVRMKHALLTTPFLWGDGPETISEPDMITVFLQVVPVDQEEYEYARGNGVEALPARFEEVRIDVFESPPVGGDVAVPGAPGAPERTTVHLLAGHKESGDPVLEEVLVDRLDAGRYRLVATPGLVLGVAAGDVIRLQGDEVVVVERGGNLAVQVYGPHELADEAIPEVWRLGGTLDGRDEGLTVFTLPVAATFPRVEALFGDWWPATPRWSGTTATSTTRRTA